MSKTIYARQPDQLSMHISREFAGPNEMVWPAWTDSRILDQWWAPKPWKAKTKSMDFREGGIWLYCMEGPNGEQYWTKVLFSVVSALKGFEATDSFCDENGQDDHSLPALHWKTVFEPSNTGTRVEIDIRCSSQEDLEKILAMGFETGFAMAHENLDQYLEAQAK